MKPSLLRIFFSVALLAVGFGTVAGRAQDLNAVKARIAQRLSKVDELKSKGAVGENNHGLLESRGGDADAAAVIAAENADREAVYAVLAKQAGSSAEQVARARAKQIAAISAAGVWIQHDNGTWVKK